MAREKNTNPDHLGAGRMMLWKSSDIAAAGLNVIVLTYLSIYCTNVLGIDAAVLGTLLLVSKVVDAFTDIFAGWLVDNTHTKLGKARPYEIAIVGMMLCSLGLFSASPEWSNTLKLVYVFCMYTMVFSVFSTLRNAAVNPYTIRHFSNNNKLITKVASYGGIITMAGSLLVSVLFPRVMTKLATSPAGWTKTVAIFIIPLTLISVLRFIFCPEDPSVDGDPKEFKPVKLKEIFQMFARNKYVWIYSIIMLAYNISTSLAVSTYYYQYIIGDMSKLSISYIFSFAFLPIMFTYPWLMKKIGSMGKMVAMFAFIGVGGWLLAFFGGSNLVMVLIGAALGAFATMPLAYYPVLFIMRICTYNEMIGLQRMDGSANILSNFMTKFGGALGSFITGILLSAGGFISSVAGQTVTQPDSALMMIRVDFALVPAALLTIIAICALAFSKLEKQIPEWEAKQKAAVNQA